MLLTSPKRDTWTALTAMAAGALTWQSIALLAGLLAAWAGMGLLAEWQARRTLVALVRAAPRGLIVISQNASRGETLWLVWRTDSDQRRRPTRT